MLWITDHLCTLILRREGGEMSLLMGGAMKAADPQTERHIRLSPDAVGAGNIHPVPQFGHEG